MSHQPDRRHPVVGIKEEHEHAEPWQVRTSEGHGPLGVFR